MITINLHVNEPIEVLEGKVLDQLANRLTSVFRLAKSGVIVRIQHLCEQLIEQTPEYTSLLSGELLGELGVPGIKNRLAKILETISKGIDLTVIPVRRVGKSLEGGMKIGILEKDFRDILSLAEAEYVTEKGETIPWLEWLIVAGDQIIVWGYDVTFDLSQSGRARSRTGMALMVKGAGWRVSPAFSGTVEDNFLTRAFDIPGVERAIAKILAEEIQKRV